MKIAETVAEVRQQVKAWRKEGLTVGLVLFPFLRQLVRMDEAEAAEV